MLVSEVYLLECLTGSVRGMYSSWSWGCEFEAHSGYKDYLNINKNILIFFEKIKKVFKKFTYLLPLSL